MHCVVPENSHTLHRFFFALRSPPPTPLEIPVLVHTFLSKFWLLKPSSSLKFPITRLWVVGGIFWYHIRLLHRSIMYIVHCLHFRLVH